MTRFAAEVADPAVAAIANDLDTPVRVAVRGRRGVGRRTVTRALCAAGVAPGDGPDPADLVVYLVAEAVKPEDIAAVATLPQPVAVAWNKADLAGVTSGAAARIGMPVLPLAGLYAVAALTDVLDDTRWAALRALAAGPADARRPECLIDALGVAGIDRVLPAVRRGCSRDQVRALLRRLSGVDRVVERLDALAAVVRYRRLLAAVRRLAALAVADGRIDAFLSRDETVLARMAAAMELAQAAGLTAEPAADADAQLRRARHWHRYRCGPVDALHRACGSDIARGSLRLWFRAGA